MALALILFILSLHTAQADFTWKSTVDEHRDDPWNARLQLTMHNGAEQQISIGRLAGDTLFTRATCVWEVPWNTLVLDVSRGDVALPKPVLPLRIVFQHTTPLPNAVKLVEWVSPSRGVVQVWVSDDAIIMAQNGHIVGSLINWHAREWVFLEVTETSLSHQTETIEIILDLKFNATHEWSSALILPHPGIFLRVPRTTRCTTPHLCPYSYRAAPHVVDQRTPHESHWSVPPQERRAIFTLRVADLYACTLDTTLSSPSNVTANIVIRSTFQGTQLDDAYLVTWDPADLVLVQSKSHRTRYRRECSVRH